MDVLDALADDVSLHDFFMDWAPRLFAARVEDFKQSVDFDLILCFKFQDTDEVYTLQMTPKGLTAEDDEMIDFPALTVIGWAKYWPRVREALRPLGESLDARREEVRDSYKLTDALYADWEKFDVVIDIEVTDEDSEEPVKLSVVLNDYEPPPGARTFGFSVGYGALQAVAQGDSTPEEVGRSLKITGDVRIAATLGGMILSHT